MWALEVRFREADISVDAALFERLQALAQQNWAGAGHGWHPEHAVAARELIRRVTEVEISNQTKLASTFDDSSGWYDLFLTTESSVIVRSADLLKELAVDELELSFTRALFPPGTKGPLLLAFLAMHADAETHDRNGGGWHVHLKENGVHLPYRFLFNSAKRQSDLGWESHGRGHSMSARFGDPGHEVLLPSQAEAIHRAALAAIRSEKRLAGKGTKFSEWAEKFAKPGRTTFQAKPAPSSPTLWP